MAAVSAAPNTTTLTPPSSSHGNGYSSWDMSASGPAEEPAATNNDGANGYSRPPFAQQNGNASPQKHSAAELHSTAKGSSMLSPPHNPDSKKAGSIKENNSPADSLLDLYGSNRSANASGSDSLKRNNDELYLFEHDSSKWIHRDKLARIESEELQAAGIIIPKGRARSKPRREHSQEHMGRHRRGTDADSHTEGRSRKNSAATVDVKISGYAVPSWDLRLPEEAAEDADGYFVPNGGTKGSSRIPVAKTSPAPIAAEHIERDVPMTRKRDNSPGAEDTITYPKPRSRTGSENATEAPNVTLPAVKRSVTETSPKKSAAGTRKTSAPAKTGAAGSRPRTRNGTKDSSNGSQTRPGTRSGDRELSGPLSPGKPIKQLEGDPPWMISAYKPDPRLPPDQQLLPTVAKRLQQEKWEREGKFGNVYDKEFRPLNDEAFLKPPEPAAIPADKQSLKDDKEKTDEWPLKPEARSPTLGQGRTGSYSTIPKIQEKPNVSPLPSPRSPNMQQQGQFQPMAQAPDERQDQPQPEEKEKGGGCGCCIVM